MAVTAGDLVALAIAFMWTQRRAVPLPACRDKKTGKLRVPLPPCDKNGRGPYIGIGRDGKPLFGPCDKPGDCTPAAITTPFASPLVPIGLGLYAYRRLKGGR